MTFYIPNIRNDISSNIELTFYDDEENIESPFINVSLFKYLIDIKEKINENHDSWDNMKKYTNLYEFIHTPVHPLRKSVCSYIPISRSYFKMIEMINTYNLLKNNTNNNIKSFHLAEGPGGFIEALVNIRKIQMINIMV